METKNQLESALKDAMRSGDELSKRTIRMALAAIRFIETEKRTPMDEAGVLAVLQKEVKSRREAIAEAEKAGRPELAAASEAEITVLERFLPQQISPAELEQIVRAAIAETGASSPREMGQVMKIVLSRVQGRVDGSQVSQLVKQLLG